MSDEATEERKEADAGERDGAGHGHSDKSAKQTEERPGPSRAEVSNYEIVEHWVGVAAERLELPDGVAAVFRSSYREVQVQVPVRLSDGSSTSSPATASSTTARAARTRAGFASIPRSISTRCARSPS